MENPRLAYSIKEAAHLAGLGERKFHQLTLNGAVDVVRIGKRRLITPDAIAAFLAKNTVPAIDSADIAKRILANEKPCRKAVT